MKTAVFKTFVFILAALASGCVGIMDRTDWKSPIRHLYQPTCECAECVAIPFQERKFGEDGIAQAFCTVLLPLTVVDLPFEAVFDTVLVPWDLWTIRKTSAPEDPSPKEEVLEKTR